MGYNGLFFQCVIYMLICIDLYRSCIELSGVFEIIETHLTCSFLYQVHEGEKKGGLEVEMIT